VPFEEEEEEEVIPVKSAFIVLLVAHLFPLSIIISQQSQYTLILVFHLGTFHNNEEVVSSMREWLRMHNPNFFHNGILILMPRWDKYINVSGNCAEK